MASALAPSTKHLVVRVESSKRWGMANGKELEVLRRKLRHKLDAATADVAVPAADLRTVLDELGRLQQSNDRLRRQNRRARLKLQRAGLADDAVDPAEAADAAAELAEDGPDGVQKP